MMSLSKLFDPAEPDHFKLARSSLKEQSTERLRDQIISGRIPPGTKLVERELAQLLGISRMPVRDALMDLEREGLVISKSNGRYVIELHREDVAQLFRVRLVLERSAVQEAALKSTRKHCAALRQNLEQMEAAIRANDRHAYVRSDLEAHRLIWNQANNPYLLKMLNSITGPIFMFIASQTASQTNWQETLQHHQALTEALCAGNVEKAVACIELQLADSQQLSLQAFE